MWLLSCLYYLILKIAGPSSGTILILATLPAGFSHHGNLLFLGGGNWPPREPFPWELATTGIHGIFCAGTGHHGKTSRGNRPPRQVFPREVATTGIHGIFVSAHHARGGGLGNADAAGPLCVSGIVSLGRWSHTRNTDPSGLLHLRWRSAAGMVTMLSFCILLNTWIRTQNCNCNFEF